MSSLEGSGSSASSGSTTGVAEPLGQTGSQDLAMRQPVRSDEHLCIADERFQRRIEILESECGRT